MPDRPDLGCDLEAGAPPCAPPPAAAGGRGVCRPCLGSHSKASGGLITSCSLLSAVDFRLGAVFGRTIGSAKWATQPGPVSLDPGLHFAWRPTPGRQCGLSTGVPSVLALYSTVERFS
eukprot:8618321-Pyramimonas_sp.AAC.1